MAKPIWDDEAARKFLAAVCLAVIDCYGDDAPIDILMVLEQPTSYGTIRSRRLVLGEIMKKSVPEQTDWTIDCLNRTLVGTPVLADAPSDGRQRRRKRPQLLRARLKSMDLD